jgi:poly-beta-1,6-N-acetyl-D-glucosamine N-deacetylase
MAIHSNARTCPTAAVSGATRTVLQALAIAVALSPLTLPSAGAASPGAASPAAPPSAVILQYHHVDAATPASTSITPEMFELHLSYLEQRGFRVLSLAEIVDALRAGEALPELSVALTFDDAYRSVGEQAWPRLRERGWPFTVFVTTGGVDQGLGSYLSWDQMRAMAAEGVDFAAHSHSHDALIHRRPGESEEQWRERVRRDIQLSCVRLEEEGVSERCRFFAYPYGEYDAGLRRIVAELELIGFGQHSGPVGPLSDWLALPRFPASGPYADLGSLATKLYSLPLPVLDVDPLDPVLPADSPRPVLRLGLAPGGYRVGGLAAYADGQGAIQVRVIDPGGPDPEGAASRATLPAAASEAASDAASEGTPDQASRGGSRVASGGQRGPVIEILPLADLPKGRSRYNVTAPQHSTQGNPPDVPGGVRYYWYSHLWVR